jgi:O-antigen ligase
MVPIVKKEPGRRFKDTRKYKMKFSLARAIYRLGIINHKIEFLVILTWMLFFPAKQSHIYFLTTAFLLCFFIIRNIHFMKTFGVSRFNYALPYLSLFLLLVSFFSINYLRSLLLVADLLLVLCYFLLFYNDRRKETDHFRITTYIISVFSFIRVVVYFIPLSLLPGQQKFTFFASSIHEGIISGMGVLIIFYYLLKNGKILSGSSINNRFLILLLILNTGGVFVSQSKAAYLGTVIFTLLLFLLKKKKWIPFLILFIVLTFIIPNPIRSMVYRSIKHDPYATNRIDIWKMCLTIIKDHPVVGVGLDNFAEVSRKYNFKQRRGPANYFKVPRHTHNDYLKLITETGLIGIVMLILIGFFLVKKLFSSSLFNISKILLLYLLFQAFLINILFTTFFFFLLVFLLKNLLEETVTFRSFSLVFKFSLISLLVVVFLSAYFLPWLSETYIKRAQKSIHPLQAYGYLNTAVTLNPLDSSTYYRKAFTLYHFFRQTSNLEAFYSALEQLRIARGLRTHFTETYQLEIDLLLLMSNKIKQYDTLVDEINLAFEQSEKYEPLNPFLQLIKAKVYMQYKKVEDAREAAKKALTLEPDYVAAIYFRHRHFNYLPDEETFQKRITEIQAKAHRHQPQRGTYLFKLWQIPAKQ